MRRVSFVSVNLLQLGMLTASESLIVAVPGVVTAPGVVIIIIGSVPFVGGISRTLCSSRGSGSNQGAALAGRASTGCLAWVADHPQLELFGWSQAGILFLGVVLVHNDASIKFFLAGQILLVVSSTLATTTTTATGRASTPIGPHGGHLAGFGGFSRLLRELKVHISFLDGGEGPVACGGGKNRHPDCIEALVSDTLLKPEELAALGKGFDAVGPKVIVVVVPRHMEGYILVEVEVPSVAIILEQLKPSHDGAPGRHQLLAAQEVGVKNPKSLASILGLHGGRARVGPRLQSSPVRMEDVIYLDRV